LVSRRWHLKCRLYKSMQAGTIRVWSHHEGRTKMIAVHDPDDVFRGAA
jgi:hypothetical protein